MLLSEEDVTSLAAAKTGETTGETGVSEQTLAQSAAGDGERAGQVSPRPAA